MRESIEHAWALMPKPMARAVDLFRNGVTKSGIAYDMGISETRVSQLLREASHFIEHKRQIYYYTPFKTWVIKPPGRWENNADTPEEFYKASQFHRYGSAKTRAEPPRGYYRSVG